MIAQSRVDGIPVDRVGKINVEIRDYWPPSDLHVCRRGEVRSFQVLQLIDQCLLRRTPGARVPFDSTLIHHDRESKSRMLFGLVHDQLCGLIDEVVGTVPVDDDAVNAAADHVGDLAMNLRRIVGAVANVHVVGLSKPQQQVRVDLGRRARIKERVNIHFADVGGAQITVRLIRKTFRGAGVIDELSGKSCGGHYEISGRTHNRDGTHYDYKKKPFSTH